ncbi:MAG: hypothetical protein A2W26_03415 [Acidobacteria bacterium RBG_16_64_8]|nr:MAG: hypothetical protein A2W26_03415 [Acidobacteria bacterium RBG_16_64_8]
METIKVDLRPLKEGRFFQSALPLKPGDVVIVPEMQVNPFFIVGDVMHPRNYSYPPGQTLMASQAISLAGGPTPTSKLSDGMLVRYDDQGRRTDLPVNYAAILSGRQPDFPIEPNDIIFIPGSAIKTFTHGLLLLTDSMVSSAIFRVGRTYQLPDPPERTVREPR